MLLLLLLLLLLISPFTPIIPDGFAQTPCSLRKRCRFPTVSFSDSISRTNYGGRGGKKLDSSAEAPTELVGSSKEEETLAPVEEPRIAEENAVEKEEKADECNALAVIEETEVEEKPDGSLNRDAVLARVATEKRLSFIRAWEESEKCKADNKAEKRLSAIGAWENTKKATLEAELKKNQEQLEKKKADYVEKVKNQMALIHKAAEEKRAVIEAQLGVDLLKAEEIAAKHRATGSAPKKLLGCF